MVPPILAASAASTALGVLSKVADGATSDTGTAAVKRNDELDKQDFLTLLVAQLKSQDPLNPLDGADFAAQLAQFSSLEQLMEINDAIRDLGDAGVSSPDALDYIGREVSFAGDEIAVEGGESADVEFTLDEAATVTLEILDQGGKQVASLDLGERSAGVQRLDPASADGAPELDDGTYRVRVTARLASGETKDIETLVRAVVTGVDLGTEPVELLVAEQRVALTAVRGVYAAAGAA